MPEADVVYAYVGDLEKSYDEAGVLHVRGLATDATLDLDQQRCDPTWLKSAMPKWMEWGNIREMHQGSAVGTAVDMTQDGSAWYVEAAVIDPLAAKKVETGVYKGFSIGIKGHQLDKSATALELAPKGIINGGEIIEVSLVDRPANPNAKIEIAKMVDGELVKADAAVAHQVVVDDDCPPCDRCGGLGTTFGDGGVSETCSKCGGTGKGDISISPANDGGDKEEGHAADNTDQKAALTDPFGWSEADRAEWTPLQKQLMPDSVKKDYSDKARAQMADEGTAMPGGGYPIKTVEDLKNAIQAFGRAKDPAATKAHIKRRAKALGRTDLIPDNWKSLGAALAPVLSDLAKATSSDEWKHDPTLLGSVRDGLVECIKAELDEFAQGDDETWDVAQLTEALSLFLCWWKDEASEGETTDPFTQGDDDMTFAGLGVSPDLVKAANAETATDDDKTALKTALRAALGIEDTPSIDDTALKAAQGEIASLRAELEEVKKMAAPKGIALRATQLQQSHANEADALDAESERLKAVGMSWTDTETRAQYLELARQKAAQAADIRKVYGLAGEN